MFVCFPNIYIKTRIDIENLANLRLNWNFTWNFTSSFLSAVFLLDWSKILCRLSMLNSCHQTYWNGIMWLKVYKIFSIVVKLIKIFFCRTQRQPILRRILPWSADIYERFPVQATVYLHVHTKWQIQAQQASVSFDLRLSSWHLVCTYYFTL